MESVTKPWQRKLTDAQVVEIVERAAAGEDREDLAAEFGISAVYVGQLGRTRRVTKESAKPVLADGFTKLPASQVPEWLVAA